jgi:NAD-specific glutamate dehydrogenase
VPLLENLGFNVISERTFDIDVTAPTAVERLVVLHDMELKPAAASSSISNATAPRWRKPSFPPSAARSTMTASTG